MANGPLVSIIVAVYNVEKYIDRCLKSLVSQEFNDYEILIVNDGSIDRSYEKIKKYFSNNKVRYFNKKNGGLSSVRNYGIKMAKGKYVLNVDGDDYLSCNCLKKCLSSDILYEDPDMIWFGLDTVYNDGRPFPHGTKMQYIKEIKDSNDVMKELSKNHLKNMSCQFFAKRSVLMKIKEPVYPVNIFYEDLASTYKIVKKSKKIAFVSGIYYHYVQHPGTITNSNSIKKITDVENIKKTIVNDMDDSALKRNWKYSIGLQEYYMLLNVKPRNKKKIIGLRQEILKNWPEDDSLYEKAIYIMMKLGILDPIKIFWQNIQQLILNKKIR